MAILLGLLPILTSEVRGRELCGIEQESSLFRVEAAVKQMIADPTECALDRTGVFEEGQKERRGRKLGGASAIVMVAKRLIAKGGRPALRSILFYVLARWDCISGLLLGALSALWLSVSVCALNLVPLSHLVF